MAVSVQQRGGKFQLRVTHRLLPRPFFHTFDSASEARSYGAQLSALLARGVVPAELLADAPRSAADPLVVEVVRAYMREAPLTDSDDALLGVMLAELAGVRVSGITYRWADAWVASLKAKRRLAPGSIRKRVGALARVMDWHLRRATPAGVAAPANALRLLPRGYSLYSRADEAALRAQAGDDPQRREVPRDVQRQLNEVERAMAAGRVHPFSGKLVDQTGQVRQSKGVMNDEALAKMDFFVQGVVGSMPKR